MTLRQDRLGFLLADVHRLMRRAFQERMEASGLTLAQSRALIAVSRREGIRQVELAECLEVQPITLTRLLDQLAGDGLIERRPDPLDRRAYQLYLKPAAARHLTEIDKVSKAIRAKALRGLDKALADQVLVALRRMHDNLAGRVDAPAESPHTNDKRP